MQMQQIPVPETIFFGWFPVHSLSSRTNGPFMPLLRSSQFIIIEFLFNDLIKHFDNKFHLGIVKIKELYFWIGIKLNLAILLANIVV